MRLYTITLFLLRLIDLNGVDLQRERQRAAVDLISELCRAFGVKIP